MRRSNFFVLFLTNGVKFEESANRMGRPQFAITCLGDKFDEHGSCIELDE